MTLYRLSQNEKKEQLAYGELCLENDELRLENCVFSLSQISNLALIQKRIMVFTYEDVYYEIRAARPSCLRKYLAVWHNHQQFQAKEA